MNFINFLRIIPQTTQLTLPKTTLWARAAHHYQLYNHVYALYLVIIVII